MNRKNVGQSGEFSVPNQRTPIFVGEQIYSLTDMIEKFAYTKWLTLYQVIYEPQTLKGMSEDGDYSIEDSVKLAAKAANELECPVLEGTLKLFLNSIAEYEQPMRDQALELFLNDNHLALLSNYNVELRTGGFLFLSKTEGEQFANLNPFSEFLELTLGEDAWRDSMEASKCLALNRWTACVFHAFRAVECGSHELAKRLKVPLIAIDKRNNKRPKTLGHLASEILDKMGRRTEHKYYASAKELVRFAKLRNEIDHAHKGNTTHYSRKEAKDLFEQSAKFIKDLARAMS